MKASLSSKKASAQVSADGAMGKPQLVWRLLFTTDVQIFSFLFLMATCLFSNGMRAVMAFDDHLAIEKNTDSWAGKTPLVDVFFDDFWGKRLDRIESNGSYRPLTVLTFRLQHWLMGHRHSPTFLHCFNYLVAYGNVCLVFYLARLYTYVLLPPHMDVARAATLQSPIALLSSPVHAVPLLASLLYLVHPVHVDAVTSIVGRCELLYCFFGLLGFFCVHRYLNEVDEGRDAPVIGGSTSAATAAAAALPSFSKSPVEATRKPRKSAKGIIEVRHLPLSAYALMLSILCKDSAITFTAIYAVHAAVMYACDRCSRRRAVSVAVAAAAELMSYLAFRRSFIGNVDLHKSPLLRRTENPQYFVPPGLAHWLGIRWLIQIKNMELLFFPTSLCCEYSFDCIPRLASLADRRVPVFVVATAIIVGVLLWLLRSCFQRHSRTAMIGLVAFLWIAIPYAPVSHLFIAVGTYIAERCLYVPSIGAVLFITFAAAAPGLLHGAVHRTFYLLLLLCVGWGIFSHRRNEDWVDDEHLFRSAARVCPTSGKVYSQLAAIISSRDGKMSPEILELAQRSMANDPELRDGYYYLAVDAVNVKHDYKRGYEYLRRCLSDPFALSSCRATYEKMREAIFPALTDVDRLVDNAALTTLHSQKGTSYRQAAIFAMQMESLPCLAAALFRAALDGWEQEKLYWMSDPVERMVGEPTYCNALYWYVQATATCEELLQDDPQAAAAPDHGITVMPPMHPGRPSSQEAAKRATELARRQQRCDTNWPEVLREPKYHLPSYPFRMTQYLSVSASTAAGLERYLEFTQKGTAEHSAVLLAQLDVLVRQYCHIWVLLKDRAVRSRVEAHFRSSVLELERGLTEFRPKQMAKMRSVRRELKLSNALSEEQQAMIANIQMISLCSEDLAFLSA